MYIRASFKRYKKKGIEYFRMGKVNAKLTVGDGRIQLISKDKEMQYAGKLPVRIYSFRKILWFSLWRIGLIIHFNSN